ncbi:MAG: hypothetical protein J0H74_00790 [Chitinophagaceae bacterium]|nr:hypothetical protein [Chitinophagaceae bacterium]
MTQIKGSVLSLLFLLLAGPVLLQAQVAINTDASSPDASAMLDVKSTTKGLLAPRLTTAQRTAIASPADGLWVYDTDTKNFWYYQTGTGWQQMPNSSGALILPYAATLNSVSTLFALTNTGSGMAISGSSTGTTGMYGATGTISGAGLLGDNLNGGEAVTGRTSSSGTPTGAVVGRNDGPGYGVYGFIATNTSGTGIGVLGRVGISGSTGIAGHFENLNASNGGTALEAVTNGTGSGATIVGTNNTDTFNILDVTANGPGVIANHSHGNAGNFFINNTSGVGAGVRGETNSIFGNNGTAGVYGTASGTGGYGGYFEHSNATGFGMALYANTNGQGVVSHFETVPANNSQPTLQVVTNGTGNGATIAGTNNTDTFNILDVTANGPGVIANHLHGNAGNFFMNNTSGVGAGVRGEVNSIFGNNGTAGVYGIASGTGGYGGYFEHSNATGFGMALYANTSGQGVVGHFETVPTSNSQPTIQVVTNGTGNGATIASTNNTNTSNILNVTANGPGVIADHSQGNAGNFFINNTNGVGAGVRGETNSIFGNNGAAGVYGIASGTGGYGGYFEHSNATGFGMALYANTSGQGVVGHFETVPTSNTQPTIQVVTNGTGNGATIVNTNNTNTSNILNVTTNGPGVIADHSQGNAGNFFVNNTTAVAAGVRGEVNSIFGNGGTAGVYGVASGTGGYAGYFEHTETTGFGIALQVITNDLGTAMVVDHEGTSGDVAIFQSAGFNVARVDKTGKGFFDGGTQNSGADVAEAFDVEGSSKDYEPGDVLLISTTTDRTVVKCREAYSPLVAGVYATKPGVLLTEEESAGSVLIGKVPMGVVGVIPTKVCDENGPIHRGDILVTSSRPGYAMKADLEKLKPGQAIGKALETFDGGIGKIKVLVNVK